MNNMSKQCSESFPAEEYISYFVQLHGLDINSKQFNAICITMDNKIQSVIKGSNKLSRFPLFTDNVKLLARSKPDSEAFVFVSTNYERDVVTWKELYERSLQVAYALVDIGVKQGEVVAICLRPCPEWLYIMLGTMFMGSLPVHLVFRHSDGSDVIAFMERLGKCSFLALDPGHGNENLTIFKSLIDETTADGKVKSKKMPLLRYVVAHHPDVEVEGFKQLTEWYNEQHAETSLPQIGPDDTAFLFQSSGSTGVPKIIAHSFKTLPQWYQQWAVLESKRIFNDRPFGWGGAFPFSICGGVTRITISGFAPPVEDRVGFIIEVIKREQCDAAFFLPPILMELSLRQEKSNDVKPLLRAVSTGGQTISASISRCVGIVCERLFIGYGSTEFAYATMHVLQDNNTYVDGLSGKPFPNVEVKIVDDKRTTLPVNICGNIYIRSPLRMKEVFGDQAKTRTSFTDDGWLDTGDIGRINYDAQLIVYGRKENEVLRGGVNIAVEPLEAALRRCPDIEDAIIIPVRHPILNQEICAGVILRKGSQASEADIRRYCESTNADQHRIMANVPAYFLFLDSFPETNIGKTSRTLLKSLAKECFETQQT